MKTACALILLIAVGFAASAQNTYPLQSGESISLTQYSDNANYSFTRSDADGAIIESGAYKAGLPDGTWINYNPNGTVSGKGNYANGKKDGEWTFFNMQGTPAYAVTFHDGKRVQAVQLDERGNTLAETKTKE
jgi:antitoxin component YwqK of YwqJK toxin-antitoxin module